jgi:hypothetical protein
MHRPLLASRNSAGKRALNLPACLPSLETCWAQVLKYTQEVPGNVLVQYASLTRPNSADQITWQTKPTLPILLK